MSKKKFLVCALEASANLHLKELLNAYKNSYGEFELYGIFDEKLCDEFKLENKPFYSSHEFSAMGFVEILPLIFKAKMAIKKLVSFILEYEKNLSLNCVLFIDSPAFNIPLAKALKKANSKTKRIYYILPQVWAWKKGRIPIIESHFDKLASILPFDNQFFSKSTYVGHPLLDEIKDIKSDKDKENLLAKKDDEKIIAFLPGSRNSEIKRLMPIFKDLARNFKGTKLLCVPEFKLNKLEIYGDISGFNVVYNTPQVLKKADFAFICSGTATLEAALIQTPFVLAYKAKVLDIFLARCFVKLNYIGLANIFCTFANKGVVHPEFIQESVNVKNLYSAYLKYDYKDFFDKVSFLKEYLKFGSASNLAKMLNGVKG
ncbi:MULTISPECIES: lipid-A-disaccharide synthase [unclassified Campylobacter]|uniref:lipid-A-disaccharide synthase n=1 Tax=unclassified Campylobacter TaxID=2593542 RepID=UPI001237DE9C|nr:MULTISPECIES: lipid-A-disaccharide synthase [unclassified Campylobacter]KAA6227230.1 lipid-A-disaccharide synthase [Campylobacter sp. LR286c]KAA6227896.1 lipid-A-disaccharide synthase [Campylobacter sp. LR185c]KAA6228305.1 lipid-A-disaccharide synthase [Campylobacter sp. LR196d]KAA6229306.1 lipid-A-disaccharide synthase [Campylobacter sp. LR291e]KAA6231112.1 lipid-A-disaccharide synthase [Campylobacter sp. LR264d]